MKTKKNNRSIFDLQNTGDLPEYMKKQIRKGKRIPAESFIAKILSLFNVKSELDIDEIIVGLYRQYKIQKSKQWFYTKLHGMKKHKYIVKTKTGVYKKA